METEKHKKQSMNPDGEFIDWDLTDESSWRDAVSAFLNVGTLYVVNLRQLEPERIFFEEYYESGYRENLKDFFYKWLPKLDGDLDDPELFKGLSPFENDIDAQKCLSIRAAHVMINAVLERLISLGLVSSERIEKVENIKEFISPIDDYHFKKFKLTEKGVDVALKINEHKDNDKKYLQQLDINRQLKRNSTISARTAIVASIIASLALVFSFLNYKISEKRLSIIENSYLSQSVNARETDVLPKKDDSASND